MNNSTPQPLTFKYRRIDPQSNRSYYVTLSPTNIPQNHSKVLLDALNVYNIVDSIDLNYYVIEFHFKLKTSV